MGSINTLLASAVFSLTPNLDYFTPTFDSDSNFFKSANRTLANSNFTPIFKILVRLCQMPILSSADDLCRLDLNQAR